MICLICRRLEAPIDKPYCKGCSEAMRGVWPEIEAHAIKTAEVAVYRLRRPPDRSIAEDLTPLVEIAWQVSEVAAAVKRRMLAARVDRALLVIPGADTFSDALLRNVEIFFGYRCRRGLDPDTLFVETEALPPPTGADVLGLVDADRITVIGE